MGERITSLGLDVQKATIDVCVAEVGVMRRFGRECQKFRVWGRTMPLKEPSYAATQTARHPG